MAQTVKDLPAIQETWVQSLAWDDPLEKGKAIPTPVFWPGELSMGSQRVRHDGATFTFIPSTQNAFCHIFV